MLLGIFLLEPWFATYQLLVRATENSNLYTEEIVGLNILYYLVILIFVFKSTQLGNIFNSLILRSRWDILIFIIFGSAISIISFGILHELYKDTLLHLSNSQCILIYVLIPSIFIIGLFPRKNNQSISSDSVSEQFFIPDIEIEHSKDDRLGYSELARRFSQRVIKTDPRDVMVFGVDAPWGIGKSSFINLCIEQWQLNQQAKPIVFKFNPTNFEDTSKLVEVFTTGLTKEINKREYIPELVPLMNGYTRIVLSKSHFTLFGLKFPILDNETLSDTFESLEKITQSIPRRIIIIIDDLDRIEISQIKKILYIVRKSFSLPNINYLLCYDTNNIVAHEQSGIGPADVSEYLEKYVGAKISLFLSAELLSNYLKQCLDETLIEFPFVDRTVMSQIVGGISELLRSSNVSKYAPLIGNVRKLKKLVNIILYIDLGRTNLTDLSIDTKDLIHLLLIYINYPSIFRDIYVAETVSDSNYFSIVNELQQGTTNYIETNTAQYEEYLNKDLDPNAKFLIEELFDAKKRLGNQDDFDRITQEQRHSWACFNNRFGFNNLKNYLSLIVDFTAPLEATQYRFHLNLLDSIRDTENPNELLNSPQLDFQLGETGHRLFWQAATNTIEKFTAEEAEKIIELGVDRLPKHSTLELDSIGIGIRKNIIYALGHILDRRGWGSGKSSGREINSDENVVEIANKILGDGKKKGIIDKLLDTERLPIGFYDALLLRLISSPSRKNDLWNISRALIKHKDPAAETTGIVTELSKIALDEISIKIFEKFHKNYIANSRCFFSEIDNLDFEDLTGNYSDYISSAAKDGLVSRDEIVRITEAYKSTLKSFIIFQLSTKESEGDVGCGYFEVSLENAKSEKINSLMNDYLFGVCFKYSRNGARQFLAYLMRSMSSDLFDGILTFNYSNIKYLDMVQLKQYWAAHQNDFKQNIKIDDLVVHTQNFSVRLADVREKIFLELDKLIA